MILSKNEVSIYSLVNTLKNAFIDVEDIKENNFLVKPEKLFFDVGIETENERVQLYLNHNAQEYDERTFLKALIASNEANANKTFIKSSVVHYEDRIFLTFEYTYRYDKGLNIAQFVSDLKFFEKVLIAMIQEHFQGIF